MAARLFSFLVLTILTRPSRVPETMIILVVVPGRITLEVVLEKIIPAERITLEVALVMTTLVAEILLLLASLDGQSCPFWTTPITQKIT